MDIDKAALAAVSSNLDLALYWAHLGLRVLPVSPPPSKRPMLKAWQDNATSDEATVLEWWGRGQNHRIGLATGGTDGFDVLDFDVADGKPGLAQMEKLIDLGVIQPGTFFLVSTPSGGRHLYFRGSDQRNKQNEKAIPGVDFRGAGGMVLAPGNPGYHFIATPHAEWASISWEAVRAALAPPETTPAGPPAPQPPRTPTGILPAPVGPSVATRSGNMGRLVNPARMYDDPIGEESPLDWFTRNHDIESILTQAGWRYVTEQGGRRHFVRPGKEAADGVSGNTATMPDGRIVFFNFSSSVEMPTDVALSTAQLYAWIEHAGDMRAAASHIRKTLMPRRAPEAPPANPMAPPRVDTPPQPTSPGTIVSVAEVGPPAPIADFWHRRPELMEVWWKAQRGGVSPWGVLGRILTQVAARTGPHVQLPALGGVGSPASLNLLVAIAGNSGTGKGRSNGIAREFVGAPYPQAFKPGTGQGIAAMYTDQTKEGPVQMNDTALLNEDEITNLGAHADMQGSNIKATMLSIYMGEELGEHYANKEKRRPVKDGHYRLAMAVGVQPGNSHILLDHAESGLPQRFLWMPAFWAPAVLRFPSLMPPAPTAGTPRWHGWTDIWPSTLDDTVGLGWTASDVVNDKKDNDNEAVVIKETLLVTYAPRVKREVENDHRQRQIALALREEAGEDDPGDPDSHLVLLRIKVAAYLAMWLDGTVHISDEMWEMARWVIWVSNDTRMRAQKRLAQKAADKNARGAIAAQQRDAIVRNENEKAQTKAYIDLMDRLRLILETKAPADGWMSVSVINKTMSSREKRKYKEAGLDIPETLNDLVLAGRVESREASGAEQGDRWRAKGK